MRSLESQEPAQKICSRSRYGESLLQYIKARLDRLNAPMNYYELLAVNKHATEAEIRTAYRRLVQKYHPDHSGELDAVEFRKVQEAYETLSDPLRRADYDRGLETDIPVRIVSRPPSDTVYEVFPHRRQTPWLFREVRSQGRFESTIFEEFDQLLRDFFDF